MKPIPPETQEYLDHITADLNRVLKGYIGQRTDTAKSAAILKEAMGKIMADHTAHRLREWEEWVAVAGDHDKVTLTIKDPANAPAWILEAFAVANGGGR